MAAKRAERLVNLVIALLGTRQYVTAARIRATVPGYEPDDGTERADEAFKRMFERDKAELREMGVPLETGRTSVFDTEDGYRIARADYELPEIHLTGEEAAAVGLALRLWESAQLAGPAHSALVKLKAAGIDVDTSRGHPAAAAAGRRRARVRALLRRGPRPPAARVRLPPSRRGRARPPPGAAVGRGRLARPLVPRSASTSTGSRRGSSGSPAWSAAHSRSGRPGAFEPPADVDLAAMVAGQVGGEEHLVVVRARPGAAIGLRRHATPLGPAATRTATTGCSCAPPSRGRWPTSSPPTAPTSSSRRPRRSARP